MRKVNILIEGAPRGGKTTAMGIIVKALREAGCTVTYQTEPSSRGHALNKNVDDIDVSLIQPMDVHIREQSI